MSTQAEGKSKYSVNFHVWGTLGNYDFLCFHQLAVDEDWLRNQVLAAGDDDDNAWGRKSNAEAAHWAQALQPRPHCCSAQQLFQEEFPSEFPSSGCSVTCYQHSGLLVSWLIGLVLFFKTVDQTVKAEVYVEDIRETCISLCPWCSEKGDR